MPILLPSGRIREKLPCQSIISSTCKSFQSRPQSLSRPLTATFNNLHHQAILPSAFLKPLYWGLSSFPYSILPSHCQDSLQCLRTLLIPEDCIKSCLPVFSPPKNPSFVFSQALLPGQLLTTELPSDLSLCAGLPDGEPTTRHRGFVSF